ncbi:MAG: hypothetical protein KDA58_03505 [Planctomycetaceae bacterium]|nr:hypothetical protein [Planctomycetaceae bacterium]
MHTSQSRRPTSPRELTAHAATFLLLCLVAETASAQDMRVFTTVSSVATETNRHEAISHSLTLFHAGRVYDYMEDVGEVVIFEPAQNRFMILGGNYSATEVQFAELHQFLDAAQEKAREYVAELRRDTNPQQQRKATGIEFQMNPQLRSSFDDGQQLLQLSGEMLSYEVRTGSPPDEEFAVRYLDYADWAARLNYVLHPHSVYPTARLEMNRELRTRHLLPVSVDLSARWDTPVRLRADHDFRPLQSVDRKLISRWEQQLKSEDTQWVTFHEYQRKLLTAKR